MEVTKLFHPPQNTRHPGHFPDLSHSRDGDSGRDRGLGKVRYHSLCSLQVSSRAPLPSPPALPLLGKKCTYGVKCRFYHPERPHHGQLPVADELRAKTRAWPSGGAEEQRPLSARSRPAAARLLPREPGEHNLPLAPQPASLAALNRSLARLTFSDTAANGVVSRSRGPDWMPTGGPTSWDSSSLRVASAATPGSSGLRCLRTPSSPLSPGDLGSPICPQAQPSDGHRSRDMHSDLPPQCRPLEHPWALLPSSYRYLSHSAWAESAWGEGTFRGPPGSAQPATNDGGTRAALCSVFPSDRDDPVMTSDPVLSDMALLTLLQRSQKTGAPLGDPYGTGS